MPTVHHPIQVVSRLTGLSAHVIRVWEKRYRAVTPGRTGTNRRLYSDEEIRRLQFMARAIRAGHKIGFIAGLETGALEALVERIEEPAADLEERVRMFGEPEASGGGQRPVGEPVSKAPSAGYPEPDVAAALVREALECIRGFRSAALWRVLEQGTVRFGQNGVLHRLIGPLTWTLGDLWQKGELTSAHEHFASALVRDFLAPSTRPYAASENAPRLVVATPAGQLHEIGAIMVAAVVAHLGWRPIYLGTGLPAAELAGAAIQNGARAVCLSVVYPADDPRLGEELVRLRQLLPRDIEIVVGGRAAGGYEQVLKEIGALVPGSLDELARRMEEIRNAAG